MYRRMLVAVLGLGLLTGAAGVAVAPAAQAEPATAISYPTAGVANHFKGLAFDTCTAPTVATMQAWLASPYRAVGIYVGGLGLATACQAQPNLNQLWVQQVTAMGWKIIPIYVGRQASCYTGNKPKISYSKATTQGGTDGAGAVAELQGLGLLAGSPIYLDVEHFDGDLDCRVGVRRYVSGFTKAVHQKGYLSGVYMNLLHGAQHLDAVYTSTKYARPDLLWVARWDGKKGLTGWSGVSGKNWATHQRAKQYLGDHKTTYGGVSLTIDSDSLDTAVATVAQRYTTQYGDTHKRSTFRTTGDDKGLLTQGSPVDVVCQSAGASHHGTTVWDRLADGSWVNDWFVNTPGDTGYAKALPRCYFPFQVSATDYLTKRATPKSSGTSKGTLQPGALAWVKCQTSGSKVGDTKVWNRLEGDTYVTDRYVANASNTTYTKPVPRCV
ncbi:glycoside hydrolase domain-containing protein [Spongisporangium articulatum]|uniref:Glycoside hydrolase domain-containing protein n=1 Tax=Spongisporangium articulatum TaxID=3362603 RepID=A0ABW8AJN6_9ACTN